MRTLIAGVGTALLLTSARSRRLQGLAAPRGREQPQPNAVVWLDGPNAPPRTSSRPCLSAQSELLPPGAGRRVARSWTFQTTIACSTTSSHSATESARSRDAPSGGQTSHVRQAGSEPDFLQHPSEHGCVSGGRRQFVFAVSDGDGAFTMASIAPGTTYHAWRPGSATITGRGIGETARHALAMKGLALAFCDRHWLPSRRTASR